MDSKEIKQQLHAACQAYIDERRAAATLALQQAVEASQDDTKSSAGDKYETTREMMQQDIDRNKKMLLEAGMLEQALKTSVQFETTDFIQSGSLVFTNQGNFYMSIGAGKVEVDGHTFFCISLGAPLGMKLQRLQKGSMFDFNGRNYLIEDVF